MKIFIGVAWPYASGPRHLGHVAGAYLPADIAARYHRLAGDEVLAVSGSDQHGTPVVLAAEAAGRPVGEFADAQHESIAATFARLGVVFDHYSKTTTATHARVVQSLFAKLRDRGLITEGEALSAWCTREERALPDRYVEGTCPRCSAGDARGDQCDTCGTVLDPEELGDPRCKLCGAPADLRVRSHLFLRLDLVAADLAGYVSRTAKGWRAATRHETEGALRHGLRPRAVTRDLDWGIRVPVDGWEDRRLYVWFDAVIGYLSATVDWAEARGEPDAWRGWWQGADLRHRYFIGKDNTWFHTLWWPAILLGSGSELRLPDDIVASQYLTEAGAQLSTSRGHGSTVDDALDRAGADAIRHALCALSPETRDVAFTWEQAEDLRRTGLLGAIANPAHRVATLVWQRFAGDAGEPDARAIECAADALDQVGRHWRDVELRRGIGAVHDLGREINRRLAEDEPWRSSDEAARKTVSELLPLVDALAVAAWPVVPTTAGRIREALGRPSDPAGWKIDPSPVHITQPPVAPLR